MCKSQQTHMSLKKGDIVMSEGDLFQRVYTVLKGHCNTIQKGKVVGTMEEGDIIGYVTLLFSDFFLLFILFTLILLLFFLFIIYLQCSQCVILVLPPSVPRHRRSSVRNGRISLHARLQIPNDARN